MPDAHELQTIDVFFPDESNGACIFFIHGGGWRAGDKESWHPVAQHFAQKGYVCTSCNYRLRSEFHLPDMLHDVRTAMSWVKERADEFGFDPDRVAAYGSSAGGHLVGMLATIPPESDMGMTPQVSIRDTRPNAAVCMCPVMELERFRAEIVPDIVGDEWFADKARLPQASPEHRITGDEPPFLVVVGTEDVTTPLSEQQRSKQAVEEKGGSCELAIIDDAVHGAFYGITSDVQKAALPHVEAFLSRAGI